MVNISHVPKWKTTSKEWCILIFLVEPVTENGTTSTITAYLLTVLILILGKP